MLRRPLIRRGCSWPFKVALLFNLRSSLFFPSSDRSTREVRRINSRGINLRARNQASRRIETLGLFSFPLFFFPLSSPFSLSFRSILAFRSAFPTDTSFPTFRWWGRLMVSLWLRTTGEISSHPLSFHAHLSPLCFSYGWAAIVCDDQPKLLASFHFIFRGSCSLCRELGFEARTPGFREF